jgi:hypothetical protein
VPARWEDIGEEGEVRFVFFAGGEFEGIEIGVGDADVLGLQFKLTMCLAVRRWNVRKGVPYLTTPIWPHSDIAVRSSCKAGVDTGTKRGLSLFTVSASAVCNIEGHDNAITLFQKGNALA